MPLGYCSSCKQNVMLNREDVNCGILFLLMFTGFGWILYLIYWLSQPEDKCVICGTKTSHLQPSIQPNGQANFQSNNNTQLNSPQTVNSQNAISSNNETPATSNETSKAKFCPFCGAELFSNAKFCANCGVNFTQSP